MTITVETGDWQPAPRAYPKGRAGFAIGDVHGHADHLAALHGHLRACILETYEPRDVTVVWLGDYVDRGDQPLESLDLAAAGLGIAEVREVRLRGNHEQFLIAALCDPQFDPYDLQNWIFNGGGETLRAIIPDLHPSDLSGLVESLRAALGEARIDFVRGTELMHAEMPYVFVHAGLDPRRPLTEQDAQDLLWIREPFLCGDGWTHDAVVVHGHTPDGPEVLPHRICVDSGIYFRGLLTAVEIAGGRLRFHTARDS